MVNGVWGISLFSSILIYPYFLLSIAGSLFQVGVITGLAILTIAVIILSIVNIKQRTSSSSMQQPQQQQPLGKMDSLGSYEVMGQSKEPASNYVMRRNEPPPSDQAIYGNDAVSRRIVLW